MTTEFQTDVSLNESGTVALDIGKKLQAARIARNLDERQVATELKIPIDQVRALEDNRFNYFRSVTFARGYLKSYCRLLELDINEMLKAFDSLASDAESNIKPVDKVVKKQASFGDPFIILISVVIIAVLIFLAFWWPTFSSNNSAVIQKNPPADQSASADNPTTGSTPTLTTSSDQTATTDGSGSGSDGTQDVSKTVVSTASQDVQPDKTDGVTTGLSAETISILEKAGVNPEKVEEATKEVPTTPADIVQAPIYEDDIEVQFDADCWTEIRDSTGKILFSGVKSAGNKLGVTGTAPYHVVLGYARGVSSFKFKGEAYDFSSYTHKDLARFELK